MDEQIRIILIIIVSVTIFSLLVNTEFLPVRLVFFILKTIKRYIEVWVKQLRICYMKQLKLQ